MGGTPDCISHANRPDRSKDIMCKEEYKRVFYMFHKCVCIFKCIVSFMVHLGYGGAGLSTFYVVVQIPTITLESICLV